MQAQGRKRLVLGGKPRLVAQSSSTELSNRHRSLSGILRPPVVPLLLKETGLPFNEVPRLKRGEPATSFKVRGRQLKVDLLVPTNNAPYKAIRIPELGAHATGLPFLAYLWQIQQRPF